MFQGKVKIITNKRIKSNYFQAVIQAWRIARKACPGQFVNIRLSDRHEPLLRRPFSIHRVRGRNIEILYEVIGKGTEILSQRKAGEYLDIIGPLGSGFEVGRPYSVSRRPLLVAGGIGVAPLLFLAERLAKYGIRNTEYGIRVLLGAKTKTQLLCEKEFGKLGFDVKISTDDGSRGFKGKITDLLRSILRTTDDGRRPPAGEAGTTIYACGPQPMLKEIARISQKYKIPAQVSLEEHMACGIGACLGCVVKTRDEGRGTKDDFQYQRVCKEGPVFTASQIIW